jgi:hypothetical protein
MQVRSQLSPGTKLAHGTLTYEVRESHGKQSLYLKSIGPFALAENASVRLRQDRAYLFATESGTPVIHFRDKLELCDTPELLKKAELLDEKIGFFDDAFQKARQQLADPSSLMASANAFIGALPEEGEEFDHLQEFYMYFYHRLEELAYEAYGW